MRSYGYQEEHAFRKIQKDLKNGSLSSVLLLCGKEEFLVQWAKERIIEQYIEPASKVLDLTVIDEDELQGVSLLDAITENCETLPLLSRKKVVIVKDTKYLRQSEKQEGKNSAFSKFCDYLNNIPETTMLIFTAGAVDKKFKLPKTIAKIGTLYDFDQLDRSDLIAFASKRFKTGNISVSREAMNYLIDKTGYYNKESDYNLYGFNNDITKMIALSNGNSLTNEVIDETVVKDIETFIFNLMNSVSEGRKDKAFVMLNNIIGDRGDASGVIGLIVNQFELMYAIRELIDDKVPNRMIVEKTGINEVRLKILMPYIMAFQTSKLKEILMLAYDIDRSIKTGLLSSSMALEMFVSRM